MTASESDAGDLPEFGSPEHHACPYLFYTTARNEAAAYKIADANAFIVTRFDDVLAAARDPESFSSRRPPYGEGDRDVEAIMATGYPSVGALVTSDPPEHTRYRKLVSKLFTPSAVARHEPLIRETVTGLIDAFLDVGEFELLTQFAMPLPTRIIGKIMGVPTEDRVNFGRWADLIADSVSGIISRERALECARGLVEMQHYFAGVIDAKRAEPGDDLISDLVSAREDDERPLDVPEILELIRILIAGGTESTSSLLGSALYLLLTHPDQFSEVRGNTLLIPQMLDEVVRLESPVQWNPRVVQRDGVSLGEVQLPKGSRVLLSWAAANRDRSQFGDDADEFNIHRPKTSHAGFGHAYHFCLGAPLARLEASIACEQLFGRLGDIELAIPAEEVSFVGHGVVRRVASLPLRFAKL